MKVEISDHMLESPGSHRDEWEELIRASPKIAARFHAVISEAVIPRTEEYYRAWASYVDEQGVTPPDSDCNLVVALADSISDGSDYWKKYHLLKEMDGYLDDHPAPTLPVNGRTAATLLSVMTYQHKVFFDQYEPETEQDLYDLVETCKERNPTETKLKMVRTLFRRKCDLIDDYMRFLNLNQQWCNEAVFSKIELRERQLLSKEAVLAGLDLKGIPLEVYSKGRVKSPWIIQSSQWDDKAKADFLNKELMMIGAGSDSYYEGVGKTIFSFKAWRSGPPPKPNKYGYVETQRWAGPRHTTYEYYGPILFPEKVVVDLKGRLTKTGKRNLMCYLHAAQMKVKVKLSEVDQTDIFDEVKLIAAVENYNEEWVEEVNTKLKKHFV